MPYTRQITIGGRDFTATASQIDFSHTKDVGADSASVTIAGVAFDDTVGIKVGDEIIISWEAGTPWWVGIITDMDTTLSAGLRLQCSGYMKTVLAETMISGLFGNEVYPPRPLNSELEIVRGGNLGKGYHRYVITTLDEKGERANSNNLDTPIPVGNPTPITIYCTYTQQINFLTLGYTDASIKITWDNDERAMGWRVYKQLDTTQQSAAAGAGSSDSNNGGDAIAQANLYYMDISEPEFIDDGTIDWVNGKLQPLPRYDTCRIPEIDDHDARSVVRHLVDTYFPSGYNSAKIDIGSSTYLDDIDFETEESSLADALQIIADIVGRVSWGVDNTGEVYFKRRKIPRNTESVTKAFNVGQVFDWDAIHAEGAPVADWLSDCVRTLSRDGATHIQVEANQNVKARERARLAALKSGQDTNVPVVMYDLALQPDHKEFKPNAVRFYFPENTTEISSDVAATWLGDYADHESFRADFPDMSWFYRLKDEVSGDWVEWKDSLVQSFRDIFHSDSAPSGCGGVRKRGVLIAQLPIRTEKTSLRAAANIAEEHRPVVGKWSLTLMNGATLFIPGVDLVSVQTFSGQVYVMAVLSASYTFGDSVQIVLECGEPDIQVREMKNRNKVMTSIADRKEVTRVGRMDPTLKFYFEKPTANKRVHSAHIGSSEIAAPIDHEHAHDPAVINTVLTKDGTHYPYLPRIFSAANAASLELLADEDAATNIRGLQFKENDAALIPSGTYGATQRLQRRVKIPAPYNGGVALMGWHDLVMSFTVVSEADDYLVCIDIHGDTINVAKPHELQKQPFDGNSVSFLAGPSPVVFAYTASAIRDATYDDGVAPITETQTVTPAYIVGGKITAVYTDTGLLDDDGKPLLWIDLNSAGRQWGSD